MGDSLSRLRLITDPSIEVVCELVTDNEGQFAGLVPKAAFRTKAVPDSPFRGSHDTFRAPVELGGRKDALEFAKELVAKNKKRIQRRRTSAQDRETADWSEGSWTARGHTQ